MNAIEVRFTRVGSKAAPVSIVMEAVPRKGDLLSWDLEPSVVASIPSLPKGTYVVESVCWVIGIPRYALVLLIKS